jgi:uncharacterized protein DUF1641
MSSRLTSSRLTNDHSADLLLEKLQEPEIVESLISLLEKSQVLNDFLERGEDVLTSMTKGIGQLGRVGADALGKSLGKVDLDDLKAASIQLQGMLPVVRDFVDELGSLQKAGFFEPEVVGILGRTGRAWASAARDPRANSAETRGIFNLIGLLKDPEIARTLNFFISFARHFGGNLKDDGEKTELPPPRK